MAGYRNHPDKDKEMAGTPGKGNFRAARPYGCLFAALLGSAMSFFVFVDSIMGDCEPGPGCHDNDGVYIMQGLAIALLIAAALGVGMWLLAAGVMALLRRVMREVAIRVLLVGLTVALVWVSFNPAFETFFSLTTPEEP